ncbi:MAG TPA: galactose-1-epimerase [Verrucomicrobiales bacterium]|jgi:aldose 1-epimerase|nr:galactose-1-epimerase [Verrucomicrobiales bacterium]
MKQTLIILLAAVASIMQHSAETHSQQSANPASFNRLEVRQFGTMPDGELIHQYTLRNINGVELKLIEYGATMTAINLPRKGLEHLNVIAGEETLEPYLKGYPAGSVIGRFANRIAHAKFSIGNTEYEVTRNTGPHHIHGGRKGFAKVVWSADLLPVTKDSAAVRLTYKAVDGEEGFPGNLTVHVTYSLNDKNEVKLYYEASTDKSTPVNLTNHAYFNLADQGGFEKHELFIKADIYTPSDELLIPTGKYAKVDGTALDFREFHPIGERADDSQPRAHLYDHNYVITGGGQSIVHTATVKEPGSGRVMKTFTDQPGVQLYTGNPIGFCLETQHYPDSVHHPHFPSTILNPGDRFETTTIYAFDLP